MNDFLNALKRLLDELDSIGDLHEEVTDTDVRESIHLALNAMFVWNLDASPFPCNFEMFTLDGDKRVASALSEFIAFVKSSPFVANVDLGQPRLDLLQSDDSVSSRGNEYDLYFGHRDSPLPATPLSRRMFEAGDYES